MFDGKRQLCCPEGYLWLATSSIKLYQNPFMGAVQLWIKASYSRHVHCVLNKNYSWMHVRVGQFASQSNHPITPLSVLVCFFCCFIIGFFFSCLFFWGVAGAHGYLVKRNPRLFLASPVWLLILTYGRNDITWSLAGFIVPTNVSFCVHFVTQRGEKVLFTHTRHTAAGSG